MSASTTVAVEKLAEAELTTQPAIGQVQLDVGQPVWADVTSAAACELPIEAGATLYCLIKLTALAIVG